MKRILSILAAVLLGGLIMLGLSSCGVNKNSREWIERNRIADIYKVYPTKNPKDLFKLFPDGFVLVQIYTTPSKDMYKLEVEGNPKNKSISGQFVKSPYDKNKLSDISIKNGKIIFSNEASKKFWPIDNYLFQHLTFNHQIVSHLAEQKHRYNYNSGDFSITYKYSNSEVDQLFGKSNQSLKSLEVKGFGEHYFFRSLVLKFDDGSEFIEQIHKPYN